MTVSTTVNRNDYTAGAAQDTYPYVFKIFADSDLKVYEDTVLKTLTTDYTVTNAGVDGGGNVVFVTPHAGGEAVAIVRAVPSTQSTDYVENDPFPAATHENGLDRVTMIAQQNEEALERAILFTPSSTQSNYVMPEPVASNFLQWNGTGDALQNATAVTPGVLTVTPYIETLLNDADAETARVTLSARGLNYAASAGTDTYTATMGLTSYVTGYTYDVNFGNANTVTNPTINIDSLGAKTIKLRSGRAVLAGQISGPHTLFYDGTDMLVMSLPRYNFRGVLVRLSAPFNHPDNVSQAVSWGAEVYDTDSIWDIANPTRLTVPADASKIRVSAYIKTVYNATGYREINVRPDGASVSNYVPDGIRYSPLGTASFPGMSLASCAFPVGAEVYYECKYFQNSGGALSMTDGTGGSWFAMEIVE